MDYIDVSIKIFAQKTNSHLSIRHLINKQSPVTPKDGRALRVAATKICESIFANSKPNMLLVHEVLSNLPFNHHIATQHLLPTNFLLNISTATRNLVLLRNCYIRGFLSESSKGEVSTVTNNLHG